MSRTNVHACVNRACEHRTFGTCLAERVARISLAMYARVQSAAEKARMENRRRGGRRRSRIPTSILLIKVITLRTESANLILIDVKLGGTVEKARFVA